MGVNAPFFLECEELGRNGCERSPSDAGEGGVDIEL